MRREWSWLKSELSAAAAPPPETAVPSYTTPRARAVRFCREVVFAHMDCQSLNILTPSGTADCNDDVSKPGEWGKGEAEIRLIDFEYAGRNPRAADIANTFCEHCDMINLKAEYREQYPSAVKQNSFLRRYVREANLSLEQELDSSEGSWDEFLTAMREEVGKHTLISHLGWAIWSVAQSRFSGIEFDYLAYAKLRMEGYWFFKRRHWPNLS